MTGFPERTLDNFPNQVICWAQYNCITPRDLVLINQINTGDNLQFNKGKLTHNQIRAKIRSIRQVNDDKHFAIRVDETTVNVWRWK